jgi:cobalamin biosynthesis protein CobT
LDRGYRAFDTRTTAGGKLRYEVKRLFDNSARTDWAINRKVGALNVKALPSLATGSDRVFKRRDEVEGVDSAVVILLDASNSMFDNEFHAASGKRECYMDHAVPAVVAIHQAVKAAGGDVMVAAFGRTISKVADWSAPTVKVAQALERVPDIGSTNDAQAIRFCGDLLLKRAEARRILFVLTDGEGDAEMARANVDTLERLGVTVIGIGIGLDVSKVYPNNVRVNDASALASASFKQIKLAL